MTSSGYDAQRLRDVLSGRGGPFADPRVATDTLDDLSFLIDGLDLGERRRVSQELAVLADDPDVVVATGAALAVGRIGPAADVEALLDRVLTGSMALDRAAAGFTAVSQPTVRAELAVGLASVLRPGDEATADALLAATLPGVDRAVLVAALAPFLPDLVVARARDWIDAASAARAGVLARLSDHWRRIAVAGALRPWPPASSEPIRVAGAWQRWDDRDTEALLRVMADDAPELTSPEGIDDDRRWWIIAGDPWSWTIWRADDGALALEVLRSGRSSTCASVELDAEQADAWSRGGADALDDLVTMLRDG